MSRLATNPLAKGAYTLLDEGYINRKLAAFDELKVSKLVLSVFAHV